jgi:acetylornithine deacetylase/succinyl-diaminopimelate desuccinylase-like protein
MPDSASAFIDATWQTAILPVLTEYIRIPNKSPLFDPDWQSLGHMDAAAELIADFCRSRALANMSLEVLRLPDRTPLLFMEIPATGSAADGVKAGANANAAEDTVLLYGHLDKQPEFEGWAQGTGPWQPVLRDDRLYGRGGADDGYSAFAAITAIEALQREGIAHARCVVLIEACEESGSYDLPAYVEHLRERLGAVSLVVCLDSGCGDYERLWSTTSLRGVLTGDLTVRVLREGVHSGDAGGVVPSSFRILRQLLARLEDDKTGKIKPKQLYAPIPKQRLTQMRATAKVLKEQLLGSYPWLPGMRALARDPAQLLCNRTWYPSLAVTGAEGLPDLESAGNVLRPYTSLKLSLRVPPTCDAERATLAVKKLLEREPPYGAQVEFKTEKASQGWNAPATAAWLTRALDEASRAAFGKAACYLGEGGSIPFMAMLGEKFPDAQFLITGVLGPHSNAHGPNEFLHIPTAKRVTRCVAHVIAAHASRSAEAAQPARKPAKRKTLTRKAARTPATRKRVSAS